MEKAHVWIDHICKLLFSAEKRRLEAAIDQMCQNNQEAYGERLDGFHYQGVFYRRSGFQGQLTRKVLHESLHKQMDAYLQDQEVIQDDEQKIRQILFKLLDPCFNANDIRDAVPECLVDTLPDAIRTIERCRNPTFFLNHVRDLRQYNKVLPRIEFYSAARLLY